MLNEREIEVAALAASLASNCIRCLKYHKANALGLGISEDDLLEIANIAFTVSNKSEKFNRIDLDDVLLTNKISELENDC
ncbi:MAG: carboxymuconolactone decarboxylase family protein [Candidatus Hodarchaeales archaeon]|jgi:AhpD family alkylhydroperoxidase